MTFEARIGKDPIPSKNPTHKFVVSLGYEFGDVTAYELEEFTFDPDDTKSMEKLVRDYEALHLYQDALEGEVEFGPLRKMITPDLLKLGYDEKGIDRFMDDYAKGDPLSDRQFAASLVNITVTYFDARGIEYPVTMERVGSQES